MGSQHVFTLEWFTTSNYKKSKLGLPVNSEFLPLGFANACKIKWEKSLALANQLQ